MSVQLQLGLEVIHSYKRLAYTPWHAIAEFVDNSTQSYFNNQEVLDAAFAAAGEKLSVLIVYDPGNDGLLRIVDNAMGMSLDELRNALRVGFPPAITSGRSKYGMGMKTAACWIGDLWTVRTKKLGESDEHSITINVEKVGAGDCDLPYECSPGKREDLHYTIVEIRKHHKVFRGRTLSKIRDFLRSMYRQDIRRQILELAWRGVPLTWSDDDFPFRKAEDGAPYRKDFSFDVKEKPVHGWVGVLDQGSAGRSRAGFSILHSDRVVRGWPESWRPERLYGLERNDLINQRLFGEIYLDAFEVSHTKDDIVWSGDEEDEVERLLYDVCKDYREVARTSRASKGGRPSDLDFQVALEELEKELSSPELRDIISVDPVPPPEAIRQSFNSLRSWASTREPDFRAQHPEFVVHGFFKTGGSANDPYIVIDAQTSERVLIIINTDHPHMGEIVGSEGLLNYLRHCAYDGIAEWQALRKAARLDPDTIKLLKDKLLRLPLEIEMHQAQEHDVE